MAAFDITERKAVTETGAPSYTSAVQKWKGTAEILKAKPEKIKIRAIMFNWLAAMAVLRTAKSKLPVEP